MFFIGDRQLKLPSLREMNCSMKVQFPSYSEENYRSMERTECSNGGVGLPIYRQGVTNYSLDEKSNIRVDDSGSDNKISGDKMSYDANKQMYNNISNMNLVAPIHVPLSRSKSAPTIPKGHQVLYRKSLSSLPASSKHDLVNDFSDIKGSDTKFNSSDTHFNGSDTKFNGSDTKFNGSETKFKGSDTKVKGSETKLNGSDTKFKDTDSEMNDSESEIKELALKHSVDESVIRKIVFESCDLSPLTQSADSHSAANQEGPNIRHRRKSFPLCPILSVRTPSVIQGKMLSEPLNSASAVAPQYLKYKPCNHFLEGIQEETEHNVRNHEKVRPNIRWIGDLDSNEEINRGEYPTLSSNLSSVGMETAAHESIEFKNYPLESLTPHDVINEDKKDSVVGKAVPPAKHLGAHKEPYCEIDIESHPVKERDYNLRRGSSRADNKSYSGNSKSVLEYQNSISSSIGSIPEELNLSSFPPLEESRYENKFLSSLQKHDNSFHRSSLDQPLNICGRKTRRKSTISLMQRVASQGNMRQPGLINMPLRRSSSKNSLLTVDQTDWRVEMNESLILNISALYGKLLVVMGLAFPIAEVTSDDNSRILYDSFYLYLYFGSILFLIYAYLALFRRESFSMGFLKRKLLGVIKKKEELEPVNLICKSPKFTITENNNQGSMYLKLGAVIFGIGSMIYSGLEFGQYFELTPSPECADILLAIKPIGRMTFTFLQMYFIFLNSRVAISKHTVIARFGLMHMVGTNLCIWLHVLIQEAKHNIHELTGHATSTDVGDTYPHEAISNVTSVKMDHSGNFTTAYSVVLKKENDSDTLYDVMGQAHTIVKRSPFHDGHRDCRELDFMANVVTQSSPFLYPCTIEYSLLCAGVLYVMWKNISVKKCAKRLSGDGDSNLSTFIAHKVRHHYSVDCAQASRGLFFGILLLVLTIISLILFYVLLNNERFRELAILEANILELLIYSITTLLVLYGTNRMRELEFLPEGDIELDTILLLIAQFGVYIYTSFTIIGIYFNEQETQKYNLLTSVATLIQTTLQTLFIIDGSRRCCYTVEQQDRKPGRETVTFLIVCNLAMWAICTFQTSLSEVHPSQLQFYGPWAWTIISHIAMPLAIFYRFHVSVCLGEIWKKSYKLKNEFAMN